MNIRPLLGGRILVGYPPAVGTVDVDLTGERLLSETHLIGRVVEGASAGWTFALPGFAGREIIELPCGRRAVIDDWIIDTDHSGDIREHPARSLRGAIRSRDKTRVFLHNTWCVACYDRTGLRWTSRGLFDADMATVQLAGEGVSCLGYLDWIEPGRQFEVLPSAATGEVVGGDPEAVGVYRP